MAKAVGRLVPQKCRTLRAVQKCVHEYLQRLFICKISRLSNQPIRCQERSAFSQQTQEEDNQPGWPSRVLISSRETQHIIFRNLTVILMPQESRSGCSGAPLTCEISFRYVQPANLEGSHRLIWTWNLPGHFPACRIKAVLGTKGVKLGSICSSWLSNS